MADLTLLPLDETRMRVVPVDSGTAAALHERFTYDVPGARFMPAFKSGLWDGRLSMYDRRNGTLYKGLLSDVVKWAQDAGLSWEVDASLWPSGLGEDAAALREWASSATPSHLETREYQVDSFAACVKLDRCVSLASTSSGKTLMMYRLAKYYLERDGKPALVVTTRTNLVDQAAQDFEEYSSGEWRIGRVKSGEDKSPRGVHAVVSTWQTACRQPPEWFEQFSAICADEVHSYDSKSACRMMENAASVKYRFGFTGTLKDSRVSEVVLRGLFGPVRVVSRTRDRIAAGDVSSARVAAVTVEWPDSVRKLVKSFGLGKNGKPRRATYAEEVDVIIRSAERRRAIAQYVSKLEGNVMVLFNRNDDYGVPLHAEIEAACPEKRVMFVCGKTDDEDREAVRVAMKDRGDVVAVASLGTFSEGMSVNSIKHVVLSYPVKGRVRLLQSIGRGLRKDEGKTELVFHDFADDMRRKSYSNYAWSHFEARLEAYRDEGFTVEFRESVKLT